jgi:hypothetical protein
MAGGIGRRRFISALGMAATYPLALHAQQPAMPVIGWLSGTSPEASKPSLGAFKQALGETGYFEGRNVQFEYRWADGQYDRLPAPAADLVGGEVCVLAVAGGIPPKDRLRQKIVTRGHRSRQSKKAPGSLVGANQCRSTPSVNRRAQEQRIGRSVRPTDWLTV